MAATMKGRVSSVKLRKLARGGFRHKTTIIFEPGSPFRDVKLEGNLPAAEPLGVLLAAVQEKYDVPGLPDVVIPDA